MGNSVEFGKTFANRDNFRANDKQEFQLNMPTNSRVKVDMVSY